MALAPWTQTNLLTWTPVDGGHPQRFVVMVTANPDGVGQMWALRREDWPGTTGRWEFSTHTRKWFRIGAIPAIGTRKGEWTMARLEEISPAKGIRLLA